MGLKYHGVFQVKIPRKEIDKYDVFLQKMIVDIDKDLVLTIAGSYRRNKDYSNDIDVLVTHKNICTNKDYEKIDTNYLSEVINTLKTKKIVENVKTVLDKEYKIYSQLKCIKKKINYKFLNE